MFKKIKKIEIMPTMYNFWKDKNKLIILSVIDNLIKGGAGQAVQNLNNKFNFSEIENYKDEFSRIIDEIDNKVLNNEKFIHNMKNAGIVCGVHYPALHNNPIYNTSVKGLTGDDVRILLPKSEKAARHTVSIPMNENLTFNDMEYLIEKIKENM